MTSKLKTDILETVSGSGTIALTNQLSGMTYESMAAGTPIQVKQTYTASTGYIQTTSTSYVASGIQCVITPKYANSLILVNFSTSMTEITVNGQGLHVQMYMNGSVMSGGSSYHAGYKQTTADYSGMCFNGQYTATSTSALTFEPYFRSTGGGNTARLAFTGASVALTITEIKQ
jgi:hypothetical protein